MDEVGEPSLYYVGAGPLDRLEKFLDAWAEHHTHEGPRSEYEPTGLAGAPGSDGYYHEVSFADLRAIVEGFARE